MFKLRLLLTLAWGRGFPPLNRISSLPLDILTFLFGTADSYLGGIDLPSNQFLQTFVPSGPSKEALDDYCESLYQTQTGWAARAAQVRRDGVKKGVPERWISLVDAPEQLAVMNKEQLECISRIGYVPDRVPLGQVYGRILWLFGPQLFTDVGQAAWGGKTIIEFECDNKRNVTISCNNVGHGTAAFAHATVGSLPEGRAVDVLDEEATTTGDYFWINYSQDFSKICPSRLPKSYMAKTSSSRQLVAGMFDNSWPARDVLDFGRWVGRDIDENLDIYIYKSRMISYADNRLSVPVIWFNLKTADLVENVEIVRF